MKPKGQRIWAGEVLIGLICVALACLVGRLVYLHTQMRPALLQWSQDRQYSTIPLPGRRGAILDRRYRVLAGSHDRPTIYADPRLVHNRQEAAEQLATVLDMPVSQIKDLLDNPASPGYVALRRGAEQMEVKGVESLKKFGLCGVDVHMQPARVYPMAELAAHVVGFVGTDSDGLEGIELACDKYLRARAGQRVVYRDTHRRAMFQKPNSYVPPADGMHVVLTIDAAIQEVVEREVKKAVEHFEAQCGLGLVLNPKTSEVLAMANHPTFDPNAIGETDPAVRRNRILTDPVEPGSIFKPYTMVTALARGLTRPDEMIYCHGGLYVCGKRRLHDHHPYGHLTVEKIMVKSSNIGMAKIGQRLGNERMYESFGAFGFGRQTGIDLPGEGEGLLMPLKSWNSYTTTSVPMGQELAITPIQLATAFCALVNGGRLLQPRVVRAVVDNYGRVIEDRSKIVDRGQAIDPSAAAVMRKILVKVVNEGTGRPCRLDKWQVLGKTGTAQVPWENRRGYEPDAYLGSFIAAAPASDPSVVVLVMIRKPNRRIEYYGSKVAAPAVKAILQEVLTYWDVPPDKPADRDVHLVRSSR